MTDDWSLPIEIADLRKLLDQVLTHVEEAGGPVVQIPHDLFWAMHAPAMYTIDGDPHGEPDGLSHPELTIGSLADTWELLHSESGPVRYSASGWARS